MVVKELRSCPGQKSSHGFWMSDVILLKEKQSNLFNSLWRIPRFSWALFFWFSSRLVWCIFFYFIDQSVWVLLTLMTQIDVPEALKNSWKVRWRVMAHKHTTRSLKRNIYRIIDNQNTQKWTCAAQLVKSKVSKTLSLQINFKWSYWRE